MMRVVNGKAYVVVSRTVYIDMERNYATVTLCYYVLYNCNACLLAVLQYRTF